ncbi:GRAS family transcription factor [Medicago truncatula]|uniref:GRAS family transcription factor n=1 Tax=Medicago truncatula TaxID=3880 RepID=G7IWF4_MEDTR|nr:GRAS family transcription factor [Medicago truncatula]
MCSVWKNKKVINSLKTSLSSDDILVKKYFSKLCPFLWFSYPITNQANVESIEYETVVHIIDAHCSEPAQ